MTRLTESSPTVTPYRASADSMVPRLWVMTMNWVRSASSRRASVNRPTFASSSAASTSSSTQNGAGRTSSIANSSATAVSARSPPESIASAWGFLPGGRAVISMPVEPRSSGSVSDSRAKPPPNSCRNRASNAISRAANVVRNCVEISVSRSAISARVRAMASRRSRSWASSVSSRSLSARYSSMANGFAAPSSWKRRRSVARRPGVGASTAGTSAAQRGARRSRAASSGRGLGVGRLGGGGGQVLARGAASSESGRRGSGRRPRRRRRAGAGRRPRRAPRAPRAAARAASRARSGPRAPRRPRPGRGRRRRAAARAPTWRRAPPRRGGPAPRGRPRAGPRGHRARRPRAPRRPRARPRRRPARPAAIRSRSARDASSRSVPRDPLGGERDGRLGPRAPRLGGAPRLVGRRCVGGQPVAPRPQLGGAGLPGGDRLVLAGAVGRGVAAARAGLRVEHRELGRGALGLGRQPVGLREVPGRLAGRGLHVPPERPLRVLRASPGRAGRRLLGSCPLQRRASRLGRLGRRRRVAGRARRLGLERRDLARQPVGLRPSLERRVAAADPDRDRRRPPPSRPA